MVLIVDIVIALSCPFKHPMFSSHFPEIRTAIKIAAQREGGPGGPS